MTRAIHIAVAAVAIIAILALAACGAEQADDTANAEEVADKAMSDKTMADKELVIEKTPPAVSFRPKDDFDGTIAKPGAPYSISYRIIGTPVVGSPVTVDLRLMTDLKPRPMTLDYRINDASAMVFAESQPESVFMEPAANEAALAQQVTVIPQRDGRLYLNVSASIETETGTTSTVAAIPIQVGSGNRELQEHGVVDVDEKGESVRVLDNE